MPSVPYPDIATTALSAVAEALEIGQSRAVREAPNAFTWWIAPGLRQRVAVETGPPHGTPWLRIETPIWRGADPEAIAPLLDALRRHGRGAAVQHQPGSGDVALVTRAPLPLHLIAARAGALAGIGAIQAVLAAWVWGEARTEIGDRASSWRDVLPHPERGMDVPPARVLGYHARVLRPQAEARSGAFADALLAATTDAIGRSGLGHLPQRRPDARSVLFGVDLNLTLGHLEVALIDGAVAADALVLALIIPGQLSEARAQTVSHDLLRRQLAPGADTWTLGPWMPLAHRDGRPGFRLTGALLMPLALAEPDMGTELADAAARAVALVQTWFGEISPAPFSMPLPTETPRERLLS
jgi:hypothetical protein